MNVAVFNTKAYDRRFLEAANKEHKHALKFFKVHLNAETGKLAHGFEAVCCFVNDELGKDVLKDLAENGVKLIALRCAGFNQVDLLAADDLGLTVARVPAYSPHGVAEHAVALMLALNRKIYRAHNRVREGNFSLEGLLGFEMHGKTVGILGTGKIGTSLAQIMRGFGLKILGYDVHPNPACEELGMEYVSLETLFSESDIISIHLPLLRDTYHIIDKKAIGQMKEGVMLINTSRGGLVDTKAVVGGLKSGAIGYLGLDVYEEEGDLFFEDLSDHVIQDDVFARLLTFPNVMITGHQAFFTQNALSNIAQTTLQNISDFVRGQLSPANRVTSEKVKK